MGNNDNIHTGLMWIDEWNNSIFWHSLEKPREREFSKTLGL